MRPRLKKRKDIGVFPGIDKDGDDWQGGTLPPARVLGGCENLVDTLAPGTSRSCFTCLDGGLSLSQRFFVALLSGSDDLLSLLGGHGMNPVHRPVERALAGVCYPRRSSCCHSFGAPLPIILFPNKNLSIPLVFRRNTDRELRLTGSVYIPQPPV